MIHKVDKHVVVRSGLEDAACAAGHLVRLSLKDGEEVGGRHLPLPIVDLDACRGASTHAGNSHTPPQQTFIDVWAADLVHDDALGWVLGALREVVVLQRRRESKS